MKQNTYFLIILFFTIPFSICPRDLKWDWSLIDVNRIWFPSQFMWGCADSAIQTEGLITTHGNIIQNSWSQIEDEGLVKEKVGVACERWTRFKSDFQLAKHIHLNAYRFSVDWSKIQPDEHYFDESALDHYEEMIDELLNLGIEPFITVFHHIAPNWFMKKGGFEDEANTIYFVKFAEHVFKRLQHKVRFWIIFNEPVAYSFEAYFRGRYPPKKRNLITAGKVIFNQLNAHVVVARKFKNLNPTVQIGLAHMCHPIDSYGAWNVFEKSVTKLFSSLMNESTIQFFKTGKFKWFPPWVGGKNLEAPGTLDFIGVNYYTHTTIKQTGFLSMQACSRPDEILVDISQEPERCKVMYPEGLYRSIKRAAKLNIPIYVTENGVASEDPKIKDEYIKKHLYVVSRCLAEGFDVRGYFFWTLTDCYSWNNGYKNKHGIFAVDFKTQERTLRESCRYLLNTIKRMRGVV